MAWPSDVQYPRRVVIDDTDVRVEYSGDWSLDVGSFDNLGISGAPYNHTMHGTNQNGASFLFDFEGDFIYVRGAKDIRKIPHDPSSLYVNVTLLAKWSCQVDGAAISEYDYYNVTQYMTHDILCEQGFLSRQKHTLNLTVTIDDPQTQMFWLDKIEYRPLEGVSVQNEVLKIDSSDPSVRYDNLTGRWFPNIGPGMLFNQTATAGSTLVFNFNGTGVSLYGFNEGSEHRDKSTARYFIDNLMDTTFEVPESKMAPDGSNTTDYYNQLFFMTPTLEPGPHEMVITFTGTHTGPDFIQPLSIDYFYVTSGDTSAQLNVTGNGSGNGSGNGGGNGGRGSSGGGGSSGQESGSSKTPVGPIVGGVIGGVIGLVGLAGLIWLLMKRRRQQDNRPTTGCYYDPPSVHPQNTYASPGGFIVPPHSPSAQPFITTSTHQLHSPTSQPLTMSDYSAPSGSYAPTSTGPSTPAVTPNQNWMDMKNAQRNAGSSGAIEIRHQDSGIRYPQQRAVMEIPPNYTPQ